MKGKKKINEENYIKEQFWVNKYEINPYHG